MATSTDRPLRASMGHHFSTSFVVGPSESKRVGSGDVATSEMLIGSQIFFDERCEWLTVENHNNSRVAAFFGPRLKDFFVPIVKVYSEISQQRLVHGYSRMAKQC